MFASQSAHVGLPLLVAAAGQLESLDPALARETYRDAFYAALTAGRLPEDLLREIARAVRNMSPPRQPASTDLLLRGLAEITTDGYAAGAPTLIQAVRGFRTAGFSRDEELGWLPLASRMAHATWEFDRWSALSARLVELSRETGALSVLPSALLLSLSNRAFAGDLADAESLVAEAVAIGAATGSRFIAHYGALVLEATRGRESAAREAIDAITQDLILRGEGKVVTATQWAASVLYNGLGRYEEAYVAAVRGCENPKEMGLSLQSMVELVEAAARLGRPELADDAVRNLDLMARATGTDWALGTAAKVRALVSAGPVADALYVEAIERLGSTGPRMELARARLVYGEWLRGQNRRADARLQLRTADDMLDQMGAEAFAERARRELQSTGAAFPHRTATTLTALIPAGGADRAIGRGGDDQPGHRGAPLHQPAHR